MNKKNDSAMTRFLNVVEWLGNLLPHPIILFIFMTLLLVLVSGVAGYFELSVTDPRPEGTKGRAPDGIITAISLITAPVSRRSSAISSPTSPASRRWAPCWWRCWAWALPTARA